MKVFVAGATGATGRLLVETLLKNGNQVTSVVRDINRVPESISGHEKLSLTQASLLDLTDAELADLVAGCGAVASCLGHNMTPKGMFGPPRRLVTDAARRLCAAVMANEPQDPVKYVLMNTTGNRNRDLDEKLPFKDSVVSGLLRFVLPPYADNVQAAEYLRSSIGTNNAMVEWVAVRPDSLIDEEYVSDYSVHPSLMRSPISDPGQTSRINVADFMAALITDEKIWNQWTGQMPVIYNAE